MNEMTDKPVSTTSRPGDSDDSLALSSQGGSMTLSRALSSQGRSTIKSRLSQRSVKGTKVKLSNLEMEISDLLDEIKYNKTS